MNDIFLLSWVYKNKAFYNKLLGYYVGETQLDSSLIEIYKQNKPKIDSLKTVLRKQDIGFFTIKDSLYPNELKCLENPPLVFCYKGDLSLLKEQKNKITIVGSRKIDPDLSFWVEKSFREFNGLTTVSGGARGVDQLVHRLSLSNDIPTVVVLPSGILKPYPKSLQKWFSYDLKKKKVLFLSQFSPEQEILKMNFYPRNHVLAAISQATLVLQAHEKSGTMVTAQYAIDLGKEVYALGAHPWDERFSGNTKLIRDGAHQTIDLNLFHL